MDLHVFTFYTKCPRGPYISTIIKAQRKEIKEMEWLINDIQQNGIVKTDAAAQERPAPPFEGKVDGDAL